MRATLLALVVVLVPTTARAYVVRHAPDGNEVRWRHPDHVVLTIYAPSPSAAPHPSDAVAAIERAVASWNAVPGTAIGLSTRLAPANAEPPEPGFDREHPSENENEVVFETGEWDYDPAALGVTVVTYSSTDDEMLDTDILFNAVDHHFRVLAAAAPVDPDGLGPADVESVAAHEVGHVLGLMHNTVDDTATMYPSTGYGEVWMRTLASDDEAGALHLYPSGGTSDGSDTSGASSGAGTAPAVRTPVKGTRLGGCSSASGPGSLIAFALVLLVMVVRRHRARALALVLAAAAVCLPGAARAGGASDFDLAPLPDATLGRALARADLVVDGEVTVARSHFDHALVVTDVTLVTRTCLAGPCGFSVSFESPGGRVGDIVQEVSGIARFHEGERVVVILVRGERALVPLVGHGVLPVVGDGHGGALVRTAPGASGLVRLDAFAARVRRATGEAGRRR